jgi:tRNA(fMet)-specific endonuclease VapC
MATAPYMLDTNIASVIIRGAPPLLRQRLQSIPIELQTISVLTEAELRFGVARKPGSTKLAALVDNFLAHVSILPWTSKAATEYSILRLALEKRGQSLSNMDMLIAAHAKAVEATLVSNDAALLRLSKILSVEDWTAP